MRNLAYHITPFAHSDVWLLNIEQLLRRIDIFDGCRVIGIGCGSGNLVPIEKVQAAFASHRIDHWVTSDQCNATWRESPTFYPMLEYIAASDMKGITFYAHAKGVTYKQESEAVRDWRNSMYHYLLDNLVEVEAALAKHSCVGTHKTHHTLRSLRAARHLAPELRSCDWHFAGTFWWFHNAALFSQDWQKVPMSGYAVEFYLPFFFTREQAYCMYNENPGNPYGGSPEHFPETLGATVWQGQMKVELGGGVNPRAGFINIDQRQTGSLYPPCDLALVGAGKARLDFEDESVDEVYSSHCLEHISPAIGIFHEICRICKVGARVELRVPHPLHSAAMGDSLDINFGGHKHTWGPHLIYYLCQADDHSKYWQGLSRKLRLVHTHYQPEVHFEEAKRLFPHLTDEQIFRYIPETCHEIRYIFSVERNG